MLAKFDGNEEALREHLANAGQKGGQVKNPNKGYGSDRELAAVSGSIGGKSKQKKTNEEE